MIEYLLIVAPVLGTTLGAWFLLRPAGQAGNRTSFKEALNEILECVGACLLFLGANMALAAILVLLSRAIGSGFVSLYIVDDILLIVLSLIQGLLFRFWWRSR